MYLTFRVRNFLDELSVFISLVWATGYCYPLVLLETWCIQGYISIHIIGWFVCCMGWSGILTNEISWFDKDENNSGQISSRLSADATTVKGAIGDRISLVVQNFTLLLATAIIGFSLQWKMTLVILATFPLLVTASIIEVTSPSHMSRFFSFLFVAYSLPM